jgi:hypothetical protein
MKAENNKMWKQCREVVRGIIIDAYYNCQLFLKSARDFNLFAV